MTDLIDNPIINIISIDCEVCHKNLEIPIKKSDKESSQGGIFRIVAMHQCTTEPLAFLLFFDEHLTLRQKVVTPVTITEINGTSYVNEAQKRDFKLFSGYRFLYKLLGDEISKIIFGLITGQQIVITGEKNVVEAIIDSLVIFIEHKHPIIESWSLETDSIADIVGLKEIKSNHFKNSLIVDLSLNIIKNGLTNNYCRNLAKNLFELPDMSVYEDMITQEIFRIDRKSRELLEVKNLDEIDSFISTLSLDLDDEDFLDVILLYTTQFNPIVSQYYRNNYRSETIFDLKSLKPLRMWMFDNELNILANPNFSFDCLYKFNEKIILERIQDYIKSGDNLLCLYEIFTPTNHYILLPKNKIKTVYCFPRFDDDIHFLLNTIKFDTNVISNLESEINSDNISAIIHEKWNKKLVELELPIELASIMDNRKRLPNLFDHALLESFYYNTSVSEKKIKDFIMNLLEKLTGIFLFEPKLTHKLNMYTIAGQYEVKSDYIKSHYISTKINYNLYVFTQRQNGQDCLGVVLDLFIKPQNYVLNVQTLTHLNRVYEYINRIILYEMKKNST
ncbi:MAG: hypothetical protein FK733_19415 [Asgard group archaeon]|nr:hypothetical protein [Asgard group archaeon]